MINNKNVCVILPAYNAEKTLRKTYLEIPHHIVDSIILVDDHSADNTFEIAKSLKIDTLVHPNNLGYGANQKTCYNAALRKAADIIIMLHPDYQYTPKLIESMVAMISNDVFDVVLGSRILGDSALKTGMPVYKYFSNRILTFIQNICVGKKLSEYHTGYRAYHRSVLESIPFQKNSDNFLFDNQVLVQIISRGFRIGEISCPVHYNKNSSSISLFKSIRYGLGCLWISFRYLLHRFKILQFNSLK